MDISVHYRSTKVWCSIFSTIAAGEIHQSAMIDRKIHFDQKHNEDEMTPLTMTISGGVHLIRVWAKSGCFLPRFQKLHHLPPKNSHGCRLPFSSSSSNDSNGDQIWQDLEG
ncbi:hypothetical protein ACLOJK_019707 [Asimina triloba]